MAAATWDVTWERCPKCPAPLIPDQAHHCIARLVAVGEEQP